MQNISRQKAVHSQVISPHVIMFTHYYKKLWLFYFDSPQVITVEDELKENDKIDIRYNENVSDAWPENW